MFDALRRRLSAIESATAKGARRAAPRIAAKLRADATTRRGNVPSFGKGGDIPITAVATDDAITITAADWVIAKAVEKGQPADWLDIAREEILAAAKE
jgi:hypothetical protein